MGRPRKTPPGKHSRFSIRLQEYVTPLLAEGAYPTQAAVAKKLGLEPPSLSKLLTSVGPVPAQAVAEICERVDLTVANQLLRAYLADHADAIIAICDHKGYRRFRPAEKIRFVPHIIMRPETSP